MELLEPHVPKFEPVEGPRPLISVMIPTYNCAELMEITLQAVLDQDLGEALMHIEVIDDCSTKDDPEEVVKRIGKGRVKFYRQPENRGLEHNFNTCIERSRGTWVHLLHGDDVPLPGFYTAYTQMMEQHPDSALIVAQAIYLDDYEHWYGVSPFFPHTNNIIQNADLLFSSECDVCASAAVVARSAYERWGGFRLDLFHTNDKEMWSRLACNGQVAYIEQPYLLYRLHIGNDSFRLRIEGLNVKDALHGREVTLKRLEGNSIYDQVAKNSWESIREMSHRNTEDLAWRGYYKKSFESAIRTVKKFPSMRAVKDILKPFLFKIRQSLNSRK